MRQPTAPRPKVVLCRICGKPDYLEGLCYSHYMQLKRGNTPKPYYTERQQDEDRERFETKQACGCTKGVDIHAWDCADNPYREVGEEYIFDPSSD